LVDETRRREKLFWVPLTAGVMYLQPVLQACAAPFSGEKQYPLVVDF
jgi:hypothetical protein